MIDAKLTTFFATNGRDAGKRFEVCEIDPLTLSGYVLRLLSALKIASYEALVAALVPKSDGDNGQAINAVLQVLQGADPLAVHALVTEVLRYVRIAPDPQHPETWRPLLSDDIREISTLGDILIALVNLHFTSGA